MPIRHRQSSYSARVSNQYAPGTCLTTSGSRTMLDSMLIWPRFMGQIPLRSGLEHGSISLRRALKPYAITSNSAVTFCAMSDTPTTLNERVLLSGVKTTLKRVAENFEFCMHGLSDRDSIR